MGVSNSDNKVKELGNSVKTAYTFDFKAFQASDLKVYKIDTTTLVATLQVITTDYSVSLNTITEGGTVTYVVAPLSTEYSFIKRELTLDQNTDVPTEGNIPESSLNNEFDRSRMIDIQLKEESDRSLKFVETSDLTGITVPEGISAADRATKAWTYDADGTGLTLVTPTTITNVDPIATKGDLVQGGNTGSPEALNIGQIGQFAGVTGGKVSWEELFVKGADIASATALPIGADGNSFDVTGTVTITSFTGMRVGQVVMLQFDDAVLLTHHATDLVLPNAANFTTSAGDILLFHCYATGDVRQVAFNRRFLPGSQAQKVATNTGAVATGSTVIPVDDTIPQITEGDQFMSLAITPKNALNVLEVDVCIVVSGSATGTFVIALFQDSTADALKAVMDNANADTRPRTMFFRHRMIAGTTSETTFKVRAGLSVAGTTTFNGIGGARKMGGVSGSSMTITEITVDLFTP